MPSFGFTKINLVLLSQKLFTPCNRKSEKLRVLLHATSYFKAFGVLGAAMFGFAKLDSKFIIIFSKLLVKPQKSGPGRAGSTLFFMPLLMCNYGQFKAIY